MSNTTASETAYIAKIGETIGWFSLIATVFTFAIFATHKELRIKVKQMLY
jgi:hypothetical protein